MDMETKTATGLFNVEAGVAAANARAQKLMMYHAYGGMAKAVAAVDLPKSDEEMWRRQLQLRAHLWSRLAEDLLALAAGRHTVRIAEVMPLLDDLGETEDIDAVLRAGEVAVQ